MQGVDISSRSSVIVVEDDPVTCRLIVEWLRAAGHDARGLSRAQELLSLEQLDQVDLLVLDIELPDGDGYELARWARQRSEVGIIFLSRRSEAKDRVYGLDLGGDDFIVKPPDLDELLARVRAVLRRKRPERPREPAAPPHHNGRLAFDAWAFDPARYALESAS